MVMLRNFSSTEFKVTLFWCPILYNYGTGCQPKRSEALCMRIQNSRMLLRTHIVRVASVLTTSFGFISFSINVLIKDAKLELVWKCTPVNNNVLINGINITMNHHSLVSTSSLSHFIQRSEHAHYTYPYTINRIS